MTKVQVKVYRPFVRYYVCMAKKVRSYSTAQKGKAVEIYMSEGLTAASRQTGIPKSTITEWTKRAGVRPTEAPKALEQATQTLVAQRAEKRERLRVLLLDNAINALERMNEEYQEFKGKDNDEVIYHAPPAEAMARFATAAAILNDKLRLELGETTDRSEVNLSAVDRRSTAVAALQELTE